MTHLRRTRRSGRKAAIENRILEFAPYFRYPFTRIGYWLGECRILKSYNHLRAMWIVLIAVGVLQFFELPSYIGLGLMLLAVVLGTIGLLKKFS